MTEFAVCPEWGCGMPAEITRRDVLESTDGPIEHIGILCLNRHLFFMPAEMLDRTTNILEGESNNEQPIK